MIHPFKGSCAQCLRFWYEQQGIFLKHREPKLPGFDMFDHKFICAPQLVQQLIDFRFNYSCSSLILTIIAIMFQWYHLSQLKWQWMEYPHLAPYRPWPSKITPGVFGVEQSFHPQIFLIEDSRLAFVFKTNLVISATFDPVIIGCFSCHTFFINPIFICNDWYLLVIIKYQSELIDNSSFH